MVVEKMWMRAYVREMMGSILIYALLLVIAMTYARPLPDSALRTGWLLTPMIGFALLIWSVVRHFHRIDEYARRLFLEACAVASALTVGLTFTYGFLENAGFPRLSMFSVWFVFCGALACTTIVRAWTAR